MKAKVNNPTEAKKIEVELEGAEYLLSEFQGVHKILKALLLIFEQTKNVIGNDREIILAAFNPILDMEVNHIGNLVEHQQGRIKYLYEELEKLVEVK